MANVLQIENLQCAYGDSKPVLSIDRLGIPHGTLVFIIGRSGIGKSTFIETLGLMNKTIVPASHTKIAFSTNQDGDSKSIELKDCWSLSNSELSALRLGYFSFIFQQTNLMPNFSAGENMMVSRLIEKQDQKTAKEEVLKVMSQLSLDAALFDRNITHLSGGQRQRLAFVRAITANFTILFGDEPTGNLDRNTAEELMGILKRQIQEKQKTGVIVSHDLPLAVKFADIIVPITPILDQDGDSSGEVLAQNIITNQNGQWSDGNQSAVTDPIEYLSAFLEA